MFLLIVFVGVTLMFCVWCLCSVAVCVAVLVCVGVCVS